MGTPNLDTMVSRFLAWRLPQGFYPDCYISFDRQKAGQGSWPTGANLLTSEQAREMLAHVVGGAEVAPDQRPNRQEVAAATGETTPDKQPSYLFEPPHAKCQGDRCMSTDGYGHSRECIREAGKTQGWTPTEDDFSGCGPSAPIETQADLDGHQATGPAPLPEASPETKGQCNDERACGSCFSGQGECEVKADTDGWIQWAGGECPVSTDTMVSVELRNGTVRHGLTARCWLWDHEGMPGDIVAYRVVQQPAETTDPIESAIQAKGLTAPRVTPSDVEANIASEHYMIASAGLVGGTEYQDDALSQITFCVLLLRNGTKIVGINYGAIDPAQHNAQRGREDARADAVRQIWPLLGYALRERLAQPAPETPFASKRVPPVHAKHPALAAMTPIEP